MAPTHTTPAFDGPDDPLASAERWAATTQSLQRVARSIVGDAATAEDIVQNAWVDALERRRREPSGGALGVPGIGWFRKLVQSRSIDVVRRRSTAPQLFDMDAASSVPQPGDPLSETLSMQRAVLDAVDALREPYRAVVFMRYFEELGPADIALRLGVPRKTVQTRLTRAHHMLRDSLQSNLRDDEGEWSPALLAFAGAPALQKSALITLVTSTLMLKKIVLTAVAALILAAGWIALRPTDGGESPQPLANGAAVVQVGGLSSDEHVVAVGDGDPIGREAVSIAAPQSSASPVTTRETGSLRLRVLRSTGDPVAGVHVIATLAHESAYLRRQFRRRSDGDGLVEFASLPVGMIELSSDRGRTAETGDVEIRAGETVESTFVIPRGLHVSGLVHDENRRPVPGAGVWLTNRADRWAQGAVVVRTDASGRFEIIDAPAGQSIGAVAAGFQPSALVDLDEVDTSGGSATIEVALAAGGAALWGMVRGPSGEPVADALVAVGDASGTGWRRAGGRNTEVWTARTVRTDAKGTYVLDGLKPGEHPVQVRHADHALWNGSVELVGGRRHALDMMLDKGVIVRGTVTDATGAPVEGASVLAFHDPLPDSYLQGRRIEYRGAFKGPAAVSDAAGAFELHAVAPGSMSFYAFAPRYTPEGEHEDLHFAVAHLELALGSDTTWNPVLADGRVIEGRTLYRDGSPIQEVYVSAEGADGKAGRVAYSTDGHYRFLNLGEGPYTLRVQDWRRPDGTRQPIAEGVYPDRRPVDLIATYDAPVSSLKASVHIRLDVDPSGWAADAVVVLESAEDHRWYGGTRVDNDWTFQLGSPGTYRPVALIDARAICTGEDFEVHAGDTIDLPDLVPGPSGTLVLRIRRPSDPVTTGVRAFLRRKPSKRAEVFDVGGLAELRIERLEPGPGKITFTGDNVASLDVLFDVIAGEETRLDVPLLAAVQVIAQVEWPSGEGTGAMTLRYVDRTSGAVTYEVELDDLTDYSSPMPWTSLLPIGRYTFEVMMNGRAHYSEEFEVTSLDPELAPSPGAH